MFAAWIDTLALVAVAMPLWIIARLAVGSGFHLDPARFLAFNPLVVPGAVLFLLVNGYLLASRGQTVGKAALGTRIVRPDGSKVSALRMLGLRYGVGFAVSIIPLLGNLYGTIDCLLIFRQSRRCLHDEIADTIVVRI